MEPSRPAEPSNGPRDPDARPCGRCGYDARGVASPTCPECGFELARIPLLRYADRGWLDRVVLGMHLAWYGAVAVGVVGIVASFLRPTLLAPLGSLFGVGSGTMGRILMCAAGTGLVFGTWLVVSPDPDRDEEREILPAIGISERAAIRIGICIVGVLGMTVLFGRGALPEWVVGASSIVMLALSALVVVRTGRIVRGFVERSEAKQGIDLASIGRIDNWVGWVCFGLFFVAVVQLVQRGPAAFFPALVQGARPIGFLILFVGVLSLARPRRALASERRIARELDQKGTP
jgi:ribosomal protein L37E